MANLLLLLASRLAGAVKAYFARVGGDGGTTVNQQHAQEVYTDTNPYDPTLIQSCDSGKATTLYSLLVNPQALLETFTGSAAAYSLRSLSAGTINVVKVRRSGDDAELNFTATEVSDGTLASWVTAGGGTQDGFVTTWYDQSGNGYNATQATAASQPKIVSSGSLVTENGKAAMDFDGVDDYLQSSITGFQSITNLSTFSVVTPTDSAAADTATMTLWGFGKVGGAINKALSISSATSVLSGEKITIIFENLTARRLGSSTYSRSANEQSLISSNHLQSGTSLFSQGSQVTLDLSSNMTTSTSATPSDTGYTADDNVQIGALFVDGTGLVAFEPERFQEVIFYNSDKSAKRTGIEANINDYYNIYP